MEPVHIPEVIIPEQNHLTNAFVGLMANALGRDIEGTKKLLDIK